MRQSLFQGGDAEDFATAPHGAAGDDGGDADRGSPGSHWEAVYALGDLARGATRDIEELWRAGLGRRATSVMWREGSATVSEPETYTLDSEDTSLSSTRASTSATTGTVPGSAVRLGRRTTRGFSVVVRGGSSPHALFNRGYRGRSVTRRERQGSRGAAMRHRHPTHTPSRRLESPLRRVPTAALHRAVPTRMVPFIGFHQIGRVREEQVEGAG
eukprot:TRINITY_DN18467_c0_g1_i1.p1 TRINITY_DN18467_c0_g1~~TRINITY_DN18467_c0_g1_i1.p1  ORF type:complete len:214 (+),score=21.50 TRINITY_DN18467_c0_g1_i1:91-732(+)